MQNSPEVPSNAAPKGAGSRSVSPAAVVVAVVALAGMIAGAVYLEEIRGYVALQAWDQNAPKKLVTDFIRDSDAPDNAAVAEQLGEGFVIERDDSGRISVVKYPHMNGQRSDPPKNLVPAGPPKDMDVVMRKRAESVFFNVRAQFANGKWGVFRVERPKGKLRIIELPQIYDDTKPMDLTHY